MQSSKGGLKTSRAFRRGTLSRGLSPSKSRTRWWICRPPERLAGNEVIQKQVDYRSRRRHEKSNSNAEGDGKEAFLNL